MELTICMSKGKLQANNINAMYKSCRSHASKLMVAFNYNYFKKIQMSNHIYIQCGSAGLKKYLTIILLNILYLALMF